MNLICVLIFGNLVSKDKEPQLYDHVMILLGKLTTNIIFIFQSLGSTSYFKKYFLFCSSENAVEFLTELGCRLEFEYIAKGFVFRKGRMKITVR